MVRDFTETYFRTDVNTYPFTHVLFEPKHYLLSIVKTLKPIIKAVMSKILFIIFLNFNLLVTVPYISFVEVILRSFEFTFLNAQFF